MIMLVSCVDVFKSLIIEEYIWLTNLSFRSIFRKKIKVFENKKKFKATQVISSHLSDFKRFIKYSYNLHNSNNFITHKFVLVRKGANSLNLFFLLFL